MGKVDWHRVVLISTMNISLNKKGVGAPKKGPAVADLFGADSDEEEDTVNVSSGAIRPPSDPEVLKAADKLAEWVANKGRQFEDLTRERNPGVTPFKWVGSCAWWCSMPHAPLFYTGIP